MEQAIEKRLFTISPSSIGASECPFYFKSSQDKKAAGVTGDGPETPLFLLNGRFAHEVVEKYTKSLLNLKQYSDIRLFDSIFDAVWDVSNLPETTHDTLKNDLLLPYIESFSVDPETCWGAEVSIALNWNLEQVEWDAPDAWLRCKLDRVDIFTGDNTALITDYKTSFYMPPAADLKSSLQTEVYPFVLHKLNPYIEKFLVQYDYIRWCKKSQPIEVLTADFDRIEKKLRSFTERMEKKFADLSTKWEARPCGLCSICKFECPLVDMDIKPLKTLEDAQDAGRQIIAIKKKADDITERLKVFAKETPVDIEMGTYAYHPTETYRGFKADILAAYAIEKGIDINLLLKPDTDKIKKLAEDDIKTEILSMAKLSYGSRFGFKERGKETAVVCNIHGYKFFPGIHGCIGCVRDYHEKMEDINEEMEDINIDDMKKETADA